MSALGLDDVDDPRGVLAYAPRRARRGGDESTIRPVLERLNRSESPVPDARLVRKAPVQDLPPPDVEMVAKSALPMAVRLVAAAAVLALIGTAAAGYLLPSTKDHAAATSGSAPSLLPKPVQTVSIQRPDASGVAQPARLLKDDARVPQAMSAAPAGTSAETALPPLRPAASNDPSAAPLKTWAAIPARAETSDWSSASQTIAHQAPPATADAAPASHDATPATDGHAAAHKSAPVHHGARHAAHHRVVHHRRARVARAHAAQHGGQAAQPAQTEPSQAQPVKKLPLQAAIDRIFGNSKGAAGAPPPPQQ
jgi:hypothetical protein